MRGTLPYPIVQYPTPAFSPRPISLTPKWNKNAQQQNGRISWNERKGKQGEKRREKNYERGDLLRMS
eukprot:747297-Hanusia_phi.AAC.1